MDAAAEARREYAAMQRLNPADRQVLELVAVDGLSTGAAATALGVSPVALRVRLVRARGRLRTLLAAGPPSSAMRLVTKEEAA
ncbi:RNA polymerase sigma factor [Catellatospora sichuanensis]|uniref:RNA polymerase sigma factor n=1 Tax=Catellatospora sichuanensis TaxID=1969805 RepID=UPI00118226F8|nr:sigma factor-like helix-turn-helix DNA-binding protein [Catellatospora sichuanensis]